jgi:hypothetical protein
VATFNGLASIIPTEGAPSLRFLQGWVAMLPTQLFCQFCTNPVAYAFVVPAKAIKRMKAIALFGDGSNMSRSPMRQVSNCRCRSAMLVIVGVVVFGAIVYVVLPGFFGHRLICNPRTEVRPVFDMEEVCIGGFDVNDKYHFPEAEPPHLV